MVDPYDLPISPLNIHVNTIYSPSHAIELKRRDFIWKQYEFILLNKIGVARLDKERKPVKVTRMPPEAILSRVFLTKPDKRGNIKRARVAKLINKFKDDFDKNPLQCQFKITFEDNDSSLEDVMSYNNILDLDK